MLGHDRTLAVDDAWMEHARRTIPVGVRTIEFGTKGAPALDLTVEGITLTVDQLDAVSAMRIITSAIHP